MNEAISNWNLQPVVDQTFQFEEAQAAYRALASQQHFGKIGITIP